MTKEIKKYGRVAYRSSGGGACCVEEGIDQVELDRKAAQVIEEKSVSCAAYSVYSLALKYAQGCHHALKNGQIKLGVHSRILSYRNQIYQYQ